jgi:predicted enzyme related to lactoylglutathione lyase
MQASLRFYVDALGFENVNWGTDDFTSVSRDRAAIYLCRGDQGRGGAWVWIGVEDAEKLHAELKARGVTIRMPPTNYPWALEMQIEDPDGNVLAWAPSPGKPPGEAPAPKPLARRHPFLRQSRVGRIAPSG